MSRRTTAAWVRLELICLFVFVLGGTISILRAQVAAPPTVDLGAQRNPEATATATATATVTPAPTPAPGSPNVPEISQIDKIFKDTSIGKQGDELRVHVEWRRLQNQVINDPEVVAAKAASERARTDLEKRQRLRDYYNIYHRRMRALASTEAVKTAIEAQRVAHVGRTQQRNVRHETDGPPATPTPTPLPPGTTPTPTPKPTPKAKAKHAKKKHHGLLGQ